MQAQTPEVSGEKATTQAAELRLVSVEQLKKIHRELDACQKVIWLAGCRPQVPSGFDPAYVTGAQEQLKQIEAVIEERPAQPRIEFGAYGVELTSIQWDRIHQMAFELGGTDNGSYLLLSSEDINELVTHIFVAVDFPNPYLDSGEVRHA